MSIINSKSLDHNNKYYPRWYSPETGIYNSKHPAVDLPSDPFLDVVSFFLSRQHNGVTALIDSSSGVSISYSELHSWVKSVASGLHSKGVAKGDVVLLLLPNSIYFPIIILGVLYLGAIFTPMSPLSSVTEIEQRVADCKPCFAFTVLEKAETLQKLGVSAIGVPENMSFLDKKITNSNTDTFLDFSKLISRGFDHLAPNPRSFNIRQQDTAAIMYSSGTTGVSKGVVLSHGNFIAMMEVFVRFEISQYEYSALDVVYLVLLPMFHIYGLCHFAIGLLALGSTVVVMRKYDMNEVVKAIGRYKITHLTLVPPLLAALTKAAKEVGSKSTTLKSLKQVSWGAAPSTRKLIENLVQTLPHIDLIQGYGMTESTATGARGYNTNKLRNYFSVGLIAPNTQAKVVDWKTGSFLPPGSCGELWLRGPGIMKGYLNNAEETTSAIDKDGWLRTGDIVYFDQNGYLYIIDRLKEMIKYKGFQIAPADLEAVLASHPEILEVGVTGVTDEDCGEIPVAFVVRKKGSSISHEDVVAYVAGQVAPYKKIRKVVFTSSLPKSPAGKILRRQLREFLSTSKL